jgi:hypothetical protein
MAYCHKSQLAKSESTQEFYGSWPFFRRSDILARCFHLCFVSARLHPREDVQGPKVLDRSSSRRQPPHRISGLAADGQPEPQLPHPGVNLMKLSFYFTDAKAISFIIKLFTG